ncbi:MAG: acetate--CoA ligase [Rhodospirillales bacterium]|nr:acetate--CoA ligase [Rhodospirillales bacterium]
MDYWQEARAQLDGLPNGEGLNIAYEAVDRHVVNGNGKRIASVFIDRSNAVQTMTYEDLSRQSNRFANVLTSLGVQPGERVFIVAGRIPELYVAALGVLKARAILCCLFANFGPEPIRLRLNKAEASILITTDTLYTRRVADLRPQLTSLRDVIVVGEEVAGTSSYRALMQRADDSYHIQPTDPTESALLHFTSGTTGSPKGALHAHEAVVAHHATARHALGLDAGDVYWCNADPGWVTGISYGLIAPLVCGATMIVDHGEFDANRWYRLLQAHRVSCWYTSPTALRMLMMAGTALARSFDFSALRHVACVGEPLNPELVRWGHSAFRRDIHDTWWQTETGAIMIATCPDDDVVPGAIGRALPGIEAMLVDRAAGPTPTPVIPGNEGELALRSGWPSMFRGYWGEPELYGKSFCDGYYLTGDLMRCDDSGRYWFVSRADEMIKSAGHLIGPFEVESALLEHPAVAEVGVIGKPDPLTGEAVKAVISLRPGHLATNALAAEILGFARQRLGPTLSPREISFDPDLPKTRSGKIMRRVLKARELGLPEEDAINLSAGDSDERR